MSSVGGGSTSGHTLGLNPSASAVDRSSGGAAGFGSIGMGSGAFNSQSSVPGMGSGVFNSQSSVPPPTTASSEWWGHVASGNTLIPGAGVMNEQGRVWVGILSRFPKHLFLMGHSLISLIVTEFSVECQT